MAELSDINKSGELTEIKLSGTADSDKVAKIEDVPDLGTFRFDTDTGYISEYSFAVKSNENLIIGEDFISIQLDNLNIGNIDSASGKSAVTKEWVESKIAGATNTFTSQDGKTVTVVNGIITEIT